METKRLSVGFADLTFWSRAAEALGSEKAAALLSEAYFAAGDAILAHGGTIQKYIGDAVLFTFDDAKSAVEAARGIVRFQRQIEGLDVRYHASVATGDVLVGPIGHPSKLVVDVIGTTVNRAGKLLVAAHRSPTACAFCEETQRVAGVTE